MNVLGVFRLPLMVFGGVLLVLSGILLPVRRAPSEAMWLAYVEATGRLPLPDTLHILAPGGAPIHRQRLFRTIIYSFDWSPDARHIVISASFANAIRLYVLEMGTWEVQRLPVAAGNPVTPRWSPDGEWLVMGVWERATPGSDIYRLRLADGHLEALTDTPAVDYAPVWSPDGHWIVFATREPAGDALYRMRPDGSARTLITHTPYRHLQPNWSPDGTRLLYFAAHNLQPGVCIVHITGGAQWCEFPITPGAQSAQVWSPDAQSILYDGVMRPAAAGYETRPTRQAAAGGTLSTPLRIGLDSTAQARLGAWSPDGKAVALVVRTGSETFEVVVVDVKSGAVTYRGNTRAAYLPPLWSPLLDRRWHGVALLIGGLVLIAGGVRHRVQFSASFVTSVFTNIAPVKGLRRGKY